MKYKLFYLPSFNRDILLTEANLLDFPDKAARLFGTLDRKLTTLADMPLMYPVFEPYPAYRKMVVDDYIAFYVVNEAKRAIYLHRLLPGRMDLPRQLN